MVENISLRLAALPILILSACGGNNGEGSGDGGTGGDTVVPMGDAQPDVLGNVDGPVDVMLGEAETTDLGFGTISATSVELPGRRVNAREVYQLTHYTARTDPEANENDIDIPMRNYVAACATETESPRFFVSQTLAESAEDGAPTFGSVYELRYDGSTGRFAAAGNATLLPYCYESHGIAVSADCSRVAVLCNAPYKASERHDGITADLVAEYGTDWMKWEDNRAEVDEVTDDPEERAAAYRENDQIWLLEWDGTTFEDEPSAYVVSKNHGGTHTGAQELIYVADDSQGRTSYGFSVTARIFDNSGRSHYSSMLNIIDRDNWSLDLSRDGRGWHWACGDGHQTNVRAFYNASNELYGAICSSDGNDWFGSRYGSMGTIAIKMEDDSNSFNGYSQHLIPAHNSLTSNGGGHTVIPLGEELLSLVVAPNNIEASDMNSFLMEEIGIADPTAGGPFDAECEANWGMNCFFSYLDHGDYRVVDPGLFEGSALTPHALTRIGIMRSDAADGAHRGRGYHWIAEDADCQLGDPQLIDLHNGRYLFGYARFQCISDGLAYHRIRSGQGADRMLIPKEYVLSEVDVDGNMLAGPHVLRAHGWGGVDEPVYLGGGRVGWTYIPEPTYEAYGGGQRSQWEVIVYQSATPAP